MINTNTRKNKLAIKKDILQSSVDVQLVIQETRIRKDRRAVFHLEGELVQAQIERGDEELTKSL